MFRYLTMLLVFAPLVGHALPREADVPGGVAIVDLKTAADTQPRVTFRGKPVMVVPDHNQWKAVVGIPLATHPGRINLQVHTGGKRYTRSIAVNAKDYETQRITIKDKRKVEPNKQDIQRILKEKKLKDSARTTRSRSSPAFDFMLPVQGTVSSTFGLRRFFNGQPRDPHNGLDLAAPRGTPIHAPAAATVIRTGSFFFSGNLVYLDHGQGLISVYIHLSRIDVQAGQQVKQGEVIGTVGMTGRATGPNLHWGVYLNQTPVNPTLFIAHE